MGRTDTAPDDRDPGELYLHALRTQDSAARGRLLEDVIASLLRRAHFEVQINPGAAAPRQTDVIARYGFDVFVIEAKWRKRRAGLPDLDELRSRLRRAAGNPVGVLVSQGGFADGVEDSIRQDRKHPILLVSRSELENTIAGYTPIRALLRRKQDALLLHGEVALDQTPHQRRSEEELDRHFRTVRPNSVSIRMLSGESVPWLAVTGQFDVWLPTLKLPDPDWPWARLTQSAYVRVPVYRGPDTLERVLREFGGIGWLSSACSWTIRQAGTNWLGFGHQSLREAVQSWEVRYCDLPGDPHHTEEVAVTGLTEDGGFWIMEADIDGHSPRWVTECEVSLVLTGWPLDPEPLRRLFDALQPRREVALRPFRDSVVERDWQPREAPQRIQPTARIVAQNTRLDGATEEWVVGLIVNNPGRPRTADEIERSPWRAWIRDHDQVPVALQSWHPNDDAERSYFLKRCEWSPLLRSIPGVLVADWE